jgi:hypothetical protein
MVLVKPLWNLCDFLVPLCAFLMILCDIFRYNLIGVVLTYNFNFRKWKLINHQAKCRCIFAYCLMPYLLWYYLYIWFIYCTSGVLTICVLNLAIFPCYSNLLLRRRRWTEILRFGVLGYALPRLLFLWCYGVFHCSVLLRVILVFKDIIYVITILYIHDIWLSASTFGCMCGTMDLGSCIRWVLGFRIKLGMTEVVPEPCQP